MSRSHDRRRLSGAAALLLVVLTATRARAEVPVFVTFTVDDAGLSAYLGAKKPAIEMQVATWLAQRLGPEFPYWDFKASDAPGYPRLIVTLAHAVPEWQLGLAMQIQSGVPPVALPSKITWVTDVELQRLGGMPASKDLAASIQDTLDKQSVKARRDELFTALRAAPLGYDARFTGSADGRAVLPLGWNRNRQLALSKFTLMYQTAGGVAAVTGNGVGTTLSYPAPPPAAGLVVMLRNFALGGVAGTAEPIAGHVQELATLKPFAFYLTEFNAQGLALPGDGANDPAISIAPPR
jgi:hypothetical protein